MSKTPSTATLIGKAIGALIQNGITFWATVSTTGLIHGVLIGYLAFNAIVFIAYGTIAIAKAETPKASRAVVSTPPSLEEIDYNRLATAMSRTRSLDGTRR